MNTRFQSTHSLRSATPVHAFTLSTALFQSTHSLRSATMTPIESLKNSLRFNPRTPCGVRPLPDNVKSINTRVSIHALLAECDMCYEVYHPIVARFNPRTPCGVRLSHGSNMPSFSSFQSTHSLRSATGAGARYFTYANVSIHALLAECDASLLSLHHRLTVSIHALLAECDPVNHLRSE